MDRSLEIFSQIAVHNKYAKYIPLFKRREVWDEIIERNKLMHITHLLGENSKFKENLTSTHIEEINKAYELVLDKKILPSMRSLQFAGRPAEINNARIYNCAYLPIDDWRCFSEVMFLLLSGCGVGFSVQDHHVSKLPEIRIPVKTRRYLIGDSIEGWADAIKMLFKAYFGKSTTKPEFDFRDIREKGTPLITSGGKAPGPEPLKECLFQITKILDRKHNGEQLKPLEIHDIICHIADAVLSGGIRRAALISLFDFDDEEMMTCKSGAWYELNPQRGRANNSAVAVRHKVKKEDFLNLWKRVEASNSGEPGIYFTNDKHYGTNPCCEIALKPYQFCNLVEVNVSDIESQEDLYNRVKYASILATIQATYTDFHYLRDIWKRTTEKDRLVGVGMTGIGSGTILQYNLEKAAQLAKDTNEEWAKLLGINPAARVTTIKPSGTSSIVLGTSSGIHAWHSRYYIRRMRIGKNEPLYHYLLETNPELVEDDVFKPTIQAVISIPQKAPDGAIIRTEETINLLERIRKFNMEWVKPGHRKGANTNNVSATVSIKPDEWGAVGEWMWENRETFNGLSVLPYDNGSYVQAPFEDCDEETYNRLSSKLHSIDLHNVMEEQDNTDLQGELACAGNNCEVV